MENFGLYLVMTNPVVGYEECAKVAVKAGVKIIQLRMKHASREEIVAEARKVRDVTRGTDTLFIVNDDPSIAAEVSADGVHVGQDDMKVAEVRRLYPSLRIVGLSTHNMQQALDAVSQKPDYIGVGPVYATPTKDIPDPTLGVENAVAMVNAVPFPAVCIGGLDFDRAKELVDRGVKNFSVVRAVCSSSDPYAEVMKLKGLLC